jgi:phosphatidylinositol alpha-1,6-mannosyltransferase
MVNRYHSYKGFDKIIQALPKVRQEVPNVRYIIVGGGDNKENLRKLASRHGVSECVEFDGEVSDEFLAACYRACDVFALPSQVRQINGRWQGEGFGRVYAEAALAGKPVVGSRDGGAAEAVLHGTTGLLVDPESITELSSALVTLLKNPELAAQMGSSARRWATANFTGQAVRSRLAELLSPFMP